MCWKFLFSLPLFGRQYRALANNGRMSIRENKIVSRAKKVWNTQRLRLSNILVSLFLTISHDSVHFFLKTNSNLLVRAEREEVCRRLTKHFVCVKDDNGRSFSPGSHYHFVFGWNWNQNIPVKIGCQVASDTWVLSNNSSNITHSIVLYHPQVECGPNLRIVSAVVWLAETKQWPKLEDFSVYSDYNGVMCL